MLEIVKFEILEGYICQLEFEDGIIKIVNLSYLLERDIFYPLKDYEFFKTMILVNDSIGWKINDCVIDISPEKLYKM